MVRGAGLVTKKLRVQVHFWLQAGVVSQQHKNIDHNNDNKKKVKAHIHTSPETKINLYKNYLIDLAYFIRNAVTAGRIIMIIHVIEIQML